MTCLLYLYDFDEMRKHASLKHILRCDKCQITFSGWETMDKHLLTCHCTTLEMVTEYKARCLLCGTVHTLRTEVKNLQRHKGKRKLQQSSDKSDEPRNKHRVIECQGLKMKIHLGAKGKNDFDEQ